MSGFSRHRAGVDGVASASDVSNRLDVKSTRSATVRRGKTRTYTSRLDFVDELYSEEDVEFFETRDRNGRRIEDMCLKLKLVKLGVSGLIDGRKQGCPGAA